MSLKVLVLAIAIGVASAAQCGVPAVTPHESSLDFFRGLSSGRIVGGIEAKPHSFPWQVALVTDSGFQFCGGSILNNNYVVSAGHCCVQFLEVPELPENIFVRVGAHNHRNAEKNAKTVSVSKVILHPSYKDMDYAVNDVCLLKLSQPLTFNSDVSPVCLADETDGAVGQKCIVSGWGSTVQRDHARPSRPAAASLVLRQADLTIFDQAQCNKAYLPLFGTEVVSSDMICAYGGSKSTCQGDSGGPLVCQSVSGAPYKLVGITSWAGGCADTRGFPGVYARVSQALDFINSNISA